MIGPLIVLVAHGLDVLTMGMALQRFSFEGGEILPWTQFIYAAGGLGAIVTAKAGGATVLAGIVASARHWSDDGRRRLATPVLLFASAAGIVGAVSNLLTLLLVR